MKMAWTIYDGRGHRKQADALSAQIAKFTAVSGLSTGVDYAVLLTLHLALPVGQVFVFIAVAAGYLAGILSHFFLSRRFVFTPSAYRPAIEFILVLLIGVTGLGLTEGIVFLGTLGLGWHLLPAKTAAVGIVFGWNFLARRWWVYRECR